MNHYMQQSCIRSLNIVIVFVIVLCQNGFDHTVYLAILLMTKYFDAIASIPRLISNKMAKDEEGSRLSRSSPSTDVFLFRQFEGL